MYQMSKVSDAMSSVVAILDPDVLQGLGKGLELMSTAGIVPCDCYIGVDTCFIQAILLLHYRIRATYQINILD